MIFDNDKKNAWYKLGHGDKSKKGSLDEEIVSLVGTINASPDFYTTSSCSGRIMLLTPSQEKKHEATWHFMSHKPITPIKIKDIAALKLPQQEVWLVMESFILHVCARTLDDAQRLLDIVHSCGLKRAGIMALNRRILLEIIGNEKIEMPIVVKGRWLVDKKGLEQCIQLANAKLKRNHAKMKLLEETLKQRLLRTSPSH